MTKTFSPSPYQQSIFDWIKTGEEKAAVVEAAAGSGKTTTLVQAAELLKGRAIFVAFNKHIAVELGTRLPPNVSCSTIHSIGYGAVRTHYKKTRIVAQKYTKLVRDYCKDQNLAPKTAEKVRPQIKALVDYFRNTIPNADMEDQFTISAMVRHYGLDVSDRKFCFRAMKTILEEGLLMANYEIDFTDQLWLPVVMGMDLPKYDWVLVDEAQDLNTAQREIVLGLMKPEKGRSLWVGDPRQAIFGFAGADSGSIDNIIKATGATTLPLSICYRCPKTHVKLAQEIVPEIEAHENAIEGELERAVPAEKILDEVKTGDLIICRVTSDLVSLCFKLIKGGVAAKVRGRDIGEGLVRIVNQVAELPGFDFKEFSKYLGIWASSEMQRLQKLEDSDLAIEAVNDKRECIQSIYYWSNGTTLLDLVESIQNLFSDEKPAVWLSTIHRAKGLEADRVWIIRPDLMPHPKAEQPHELEQENNLMYVAYTRAKKSLFICLGEADDNELDEDDIAKPRNEDEKVSHT